VSARVHVKVCGVRRVADARLAVALGAEWVGCVRAADSPRCATVGEVEAIRCAIEERARVVVVGRVRAGERSETGEASEERDVVAALVREAKSVGADAVQIHGASHDALARVRDAGLVAWRVVALAREATELPRELAPESESESPIDAPVLLDVGAGGSGTPFDWRLLGRVAPPRIWIAGGITPDNVASLLARSPFGIDVSSGVESAPGIKDEGRLRALFEVLDTCASRESRQECER
jgi:phosphoribosylanthranilate isomerase